MQYLLNALPGDYALAPVIGRRFWGYPVEAPAVSRAIREGMVVSAVGHAATAAALTALLGAPVAYSRCTITPAPGDVLYIAVLRGPRLAEGQTLSEAEVRERGVDFLRVEILETLEETL